MYHNPDLISIIQFLERPLAVALVMIFMTSQKALPTSSEKTWVHAAFAVLWGLMGELDKLFDVELYCYKHYYQRCLI